MMDITSSQGVRHPCFQHLCTQEQLQHIKGEQNPHRAEPHSSMHQCSVMCISSSLTRYEGVPLAQADTILCLCAVPRCVQIWHSWFPLPAGNQDQHARGWKLVACPEFVNQTCPEPIWDGNTLLYLHKCYVVHCRWWSHEKSLPHWHPDGCAGSANELSAYQMYILQPFCSYFASKWIPFFQGHSYQGKV